MEYGDAMVGDAQMMKKMMAKACSALLALVAGLSLVAPVFGAGGDLDWSFSAATPAKQDVRASAFDSSGCTVLVGVDGEGSSSNWFVAKVKADGSDQAWTKKSFDLNGGIDVATAVAIDSNNDIVVVGYGHNGVNYDIHTIKYSGTDGTVLWQDTFAGEAAGDDIATAVALDTSNNVYVGGYGQNVSGKDDFIVLKYQANGPVADAPLWSTTINGGADNNDRLMALYVNGSSLVVTGESESSTAGDFDFYVHKLNLDGTFAWVAPQIVSDSGNGKGSDIAIDSAGNVVVTGYVDNGSRMLYTAKYAATDGTSVWAKMQASETIEGGHALTIDANDDVIVVGTSYSVTSAYDVYTVKYQGADPVGGVPVVLWEDSYNTTNGNHDVGMDLTLDSGGDVYVVAYSNDAAGGYDDILTLKYCGDDGAMLWPDNTIFDMEGLHNRPVSVGLGADGHILVGGWTSTLATDYDLLALSYDPGALNPPTGLSATVLTNTSIHLSWTDNSDAPAAVEDNFVVERRAESEGSFSEIATLAANSTSYNSTGLNSDVRYYFRVKATSATEGSSAYSSVATARTTVVSYTSPSWTHQFSGSAQGDDDPYAIAVGPDQHPVVTGSSFAGVTEGGYDYLTLKLDRTDETAIQWSARYNDGDNEGDTATSVVVDSQNRVVVTGYSSLYGGGSSNTNDVYTVGYAVDGQPTDNGNTLSVWDDQYNGPDGNDDKSSAVAVATDGSDNTVVIGYGKNAAFDNDIYVIKFDPDGNRIWSATPYDGGDDDYPNAVAFDEAGNVFVAGQSFNGTDDDWFVAKYNSATGAQDYLAPLHDFAGNGTDYAEAITVDENGDVYVTGYAFNGSSGDIYTVKYAGSDLNILWQASHDSGGYDHGADIGIDPADKDILVAGTSFIGSNNHDFRLIRYTPDGSAGSGVEVWNHRVDMASTDDSVTAMAVDRSGVATLTGTSDDDILTVKIDHTEAIVGANVYSGAANDIDYPADVVVNAYGEAFVAGSSTNADSIPNTDYVVFMADGGTLPAPTPVSVTQLYAEASLDWTDNDYDGTGFELERKLGTCDGGGSWAFLASVADTTTSYVDTPVNDNTTYCYRIKAVSATDSSRWVELETTTGDPAPPGDLSASMLNDTDIELTWTDNTTVANDYEFYIERCAGSACTFATVDTFIVAASAVTDPETGVATFIDESACSGTVYRYQVLARKAGLWTSEFSSPTASGGIGPQSPLAPSNLKGDRASETLVDLSWLDNSDGEDQFLIERCDDTAVNCVSGIWSDLGALDSIDDNVMLLRMDEAVWDGTIDEVIDLSGVGNHGTASGAMTVPYGRYARAGRFDSIYDNIATSLMIDQSDTSAGATFVVWVKPNDSGSGNRYLFHTDNGGNDWSLLQVGGTWQLATGVDDGLIDTGVSVDVGTWQHLAVTFDPASGVVLYKNGVQAFADAGIDTDASCSALILGMISNGSGKTAFVGDMDEAAVFTRPLDTTEISTLYQHGIARYRDNSITVNGTYTYRVRADKPGSCVSDWPTAPSALIEVSTAPSGPDLSAVVADTGQVYLSWVNNTTTQTGFRVERCEVGVSCDTFATQDDTLTAMATSHIDTTTCTGPTYRYRVIATQSAGWGDSSPSNVVELAIPAMTAPDSLSTGNISEGHMTLSWSDTSPAPTGYRIGQCDATATACSQDSDYLPIVETAGLPTENTLLLHMDDGLWVNGVADVEDSSAVGNTSISYSGAVLTTDGKYGSAGLFDGSNDYVQTPLNIDQSSTSSGVTFEAWVYPTVIDDNYKYVISSDNGGGDWSICQRSYYWYIMNGSSTVYVGTTADLDQWQHVVAVFEPGVGIRFYKNGVQTYNNATIYYDDSDTNVTIGRRGSYTTASYHFPGRIDEVAVYNKALTQTEVENRYNQTQSYRAGVLTPGNDYRFRVWAYRDDACSSESPYIATATASSTLPVQPPTGLTATDNGTTQVDLSWTIETTSETLVRLERCAGTGAACDEDSEFNDFTTPVTLAAGTESYSDPSVCAESAYTYRLRIERDSAPGWQSSWVTVARPARTLPAIAGLIASGVSESEVLVRWDDATSDETLFTLERCEDNNFSCATPTTVKAEPAASLVYHFDEAAWVNGVADVLDGSSGNFDGTSYNGANTIDGGYLDRAGDFSTTSDVVISSLNIDQSSNSRGATFQAWVYPTATASNYWHVVSTENGGYDWSLVQYAGTWRVYNGSTVVNTGIVVDLDQWQHVAVTFDPASGIVFYKNGGSEPTDIYSNSGIDFDDSDYNVTIGRYASSTSTTYNFIGLIDEVVIHERPLSATEILNNYLQPYHEYTDSGLSPGTDYSYRLTASKDVISTNPDGCDWSVSAIYNTASLAVPAPESFVAVSKDTTDINLAWTDKTGAEDSFQVQRCDGTLASCGSADSNFIALDVSLLADSEAYTDATVCPDADYVYRVRARKTEASPFWDTDWVYLETHSEAVLDLQNFSVQRVSEVQIDLSWDDLNTDESGFTIERCRYLAGDTVCSVFSVIDTITSPDTTVTYADDELEPEYIYRYQIKAFKNAPSNPCNGNNGWETGYAGPIEQETTISSPNLLSAIEQSTTRIDLAWDTNAPSATGIVVERCTSHPCADSFTAIATANIGAVGIADTSVCENSTYTYRIKTVGEGLSRKEEGCWNRRAKVNFTSFSAFNQFELSVPYDADMQTDFDDLRFFDETAKRELPYWIAEKTDGVSATVFLRTAANDNVYMYYGNSSAVDAGREDEFSIFYDDFPGTQIDTSSWYDLDTNNYIVQNNGLQLIDVVINGAWGGLVSKATYLRGDGLEVLYDVSLPADSYDSNYFSLGWYMDQTSSISTSYWAHQMYWYNNTEFQVYENGTVKDPGSIRYYPNNEYSIKIVVDPVAGARYYVIGGAYTDWTLVTDTTADGNRYTGSTLRLGIMQHSEEATINSVWVRKVIIPGATSLGPEEDNSGSCFTPGYSWVSGYSSEDVWETTRTAIEPTLDSVTAINDATVEIDWTNNSDSDAIFDLQRCCGSGCSYADIATGLTVTNYTDATAPPSNNCSYRVYAKKDTGTCSWMVGPSNILATDTFAATPSDVLAVAENSRLIRIEWSDNATDEDGYEIQVKQGNNEYVTTATLGANYDIHFDGRNIEPERTYSYRVRSFRKLGAEEPYYYEWSSYAYSNIVTTPSYTEGDGTCVP